MGYQVVVVDDDALAGAQWAIVRDGRGETFLMVTGSAIEHSPEQCLTRAWIAWEAMRPELVGA